MFLGFAIFAVCLIIGVPIAFSLGVSSLVFLLMSEGVPLSIVAQRMFTGVDSFPFMAIPFFIVAGELMNHAKITEKLITFSDQIIGHVKGGLAHVVILTSMFFAGISGSAVAEVSAIGSMMIPGMRKKGYDLDYAAGVTASASIIGPIIPPSIPMVIFALITGTSVGALFIAGIIPGIMIGLGLMSIAYVIARRRGYETGRKRAPLKMIFQAFLHAIIPLIMPGIIVGGILTGVFTATEAAGVAAVYALLVGFFVYRNMKLQDLGPIFVETGKTTGIVFIIIATANIFNWVIAIHNIPTDVAMFMAQHIHSRWLMLLVINLLLLFLGCIMDATAAMVITVPILMQIVLPFNVHPIHMGIIVVMNLMIGLLTPPVGLCLFVAAKIANMTLEQISKAVLPYLTMEIIILLLVTYIPNISLYLPRLFGYVK